MKKHFITGIIVLFPAIITIALMMIIANFLTKPFVGIIQHFLASKLFVAVSPNILHFLPLLSKIIALLLLIIVTLIIGFLGQIYVLNIFGRWGEYLLENIPIVNKIYRALKDAVMTLFKHIDSENEQNFSRVVVVPYPFPDTLCIGLVPNEHLPEGTDETHAGMVSVFVPGSPNPTLGFMLLFKREEIKFIDMTVEEAFHMIISLGVIWKESEKEKAVSHA